MHRQCVSVPFVVDLESTQIETLERHLGSARHARCEVFVKYVLQMLESGVEGELCSEVWPYVFRRRRLEESTGQIALVVFYKGGALWIRRILGDT